MSAARPPEGAVPIRLDATSTDVEHPAALAPQIPAASTLEPGAAVLVEPIATRRREGLGRMLGDAHVKVPRAARCTALLARGYVGVTAAGDAVWALVPDA